MLGQVLFVSAMILNSALIIVMVRGKYWQDNPIVFALQLFLICETPLFLLSPPALYAGLWPTFDKLNILLILVYARCCDGECVRFRTVGILLVMCIALKFAAWADVDSETAYLANSYHYARVFTDLAATLAMIYAVARKEPYART